MVPVYFGISLCTFEGKKKIKRRGEKKNPNRRSGMVTIVHFVSTFTHRKAPESTTLQRHQVSFWGKPLFWGGGGGTSGYSHQNKKNNFLKITQVQKKTEKCKLFWKMECFFVNQHYCDGFCSNVRHRVRFQMTKRAKRGRLCRHREVACAASR